MQSRAVILKQIAGKIRSSRVILLTCHVRADADALGSAIAMCLGLKKLGKRCHVVCQEGVIAENAFLPATRSVGSSARDLWRAYDLVMTFDSSDYKRLDKIGDAPAVKNSFLINLDHHITNTMFGEINWVDASYASTTLMVLDLLKHLGVSIDRQIAICLYAGLVTDTGHFSFSNTDAKCHKVAAELINYGVEPSYVSEYLNRKKKRGQLALMAETIKRYKTACGGRITWVQFDRSLFKKVGYSPGDTQEYINLLKSLDGCQIAILVRETAAKEFKASLRTSKHVDATKIARVWGGGGHARAAGFNIKGVGKKEVIRRILNVARKTLADVR